MKLSTVMTVFRQYSHLGLAHLGVFGLATCLAITGCDKPEDSVSTDVATKSASKVADSSNSTVATTKTVVAPTGSSAMVDENKPVSYDIESWAIAETKASGSDSLDLTSLNPNGIKALQQVLGTVEVTDENSLDYTSNTAIKYRFMRSDDPYLDLIDSKSYVEFGWYYANPSDSESEKKISIEHAKKVYMAAKVLMGEEGGVLVADMLAGRIIKNKEVGGQQVELAKCEFYSCMLIIRKPQ